MHLVILNAARRCIPSLLSSCRARTFSSDLLQTKFVPEITGDDDLLEFAATWPADAEPSLRAAVRRGMRILPDFVSEGEEEALMAELEPVLKRMRYEFDHWDNAIHGYRETERTHWQPKNSAVVQRVTSLVFPDGGHLPGQHVLDLAPAGLIKPHVDAVRFCGDLIAGLCLASSAVMRLQYTLNENFVLDALLPRRCLYVMSGRARYEFSHAVLGNETSAFRGRRVLKLRRVAVITRSQPPAPSLP